MPDDTQQADRLEYRTSRARLQHGYLLGGVLTAIGLLILLIGRQAIPDAGLIGGVHVLVGAGIIGYSLRRARDPAPRLILDADGVWFRDWGVRAVPWALIGDIHSAGSRMNTHVCIELRDQETLMHLIPADRRRKFRSNRLVRLPRLFIPGSAVDAPFDELVTALRGAAAHFR